jgi:hypothetical protein
MTAAGKPAFPLPFASLGKLSGEGSSPYIVGAMFTAGYADKAKRLAASCTKFSLTYELHEVPTVHRSLSVKGSDDLRFTKANFIHHLLTTHKRPVVYLDADVEIVAEPQLLSDLVRDRIDFAIYNWLADEYTDRFYPLDPQRRYFRYAGSVDAYSTTQLIGGGLTQLYANSMAARALLRRWHRVVAALGDCADDNCLNYTFNNIGKFDWLRWRLRTRWLPKAYARVMFWIYVEPVITHSDILTPSSKFPDFRAPPGRKQVYLDRAEKRKIPLLLPRDCAIDTQERMLCRIVGDEYVPFKKVPCQLWV